MKTVLSIILFFFLQTVAFAQPINGTDVYLCEDADVKPQFEGGDNEFTRFLDLLASQMPKGCDKVSSISFSFIVEKDGSISEASAQPLTEPICEEFIVKQVLAMRKWTPGMKDGKPIRVLCGGKVRFREDDEHEPIAVTEISDEDMIDAPPPPPFEGDNTPVPPQEEVSDTAVFTIVEDMPEFPGGADALIKYVNKNIKHPKNGGESQGTVFVEFIVERDGSISHTTVKRSINGPYSAAFDTEALRVINSLPKFKPGMQNGKPARVRYMLPVKFKLN